MSKEIIATSKLGSPAEDLFMELFVEVYGPEKTRYLYTQHPSVDIYGGRRFIDFALESDNFKIAIEIDGETYHNPKLVSENKYYDDLLKQNSMIYDDWKVYRWAYNQLKNQPEIVKDQMQTFLGEMPIFKMIEDYLPSQKGRIIELKDHQQDAIDNLQEMRRDGDTIALLYHATGARVIIVTGCINAFKLRVSGTLVRYKSCTA